jgi:hypothetical protein
MQLGLCKVQSTRGPEIARPDDMGLGWFLDEAAEALTTRGMFCATPEEMHCSGQAPVRARVVYKRSRLP